MSNEIVVQNNNSDIITFDDKKIGLIKRTVAEGATDDELELFLHQAKKTGLDPLARQIHFQKYNTSKGPKVAIITGIDGYRLVASRTGVYAGNDDPVFDGRIKYSGKDVPAKATVTVWRIVGGKRCAFSSSAYWEEYCPPHPRDYQWKKMPHVMLAKCAEAAALRKAFPADLSGVYTHEEMQQSNSYQGVEWEELPRESESPRNDRAALLRAVDGVEHKHHGNEMTAQPAGDNTETPNNLADFAKWYAPQHAYYKDNFHVVGALNKCFDNVGVTFKQRSVQDYIKALERYATENADKQD